MGNLLQLARCIFHFNLHFVRVVRLKAKSVERLTKSDLLVIAEVHVLKLILSLLLSK